MDNWEEARIQTKEEARLEQEKKAWRNLMSSINLIGNLPPEKLNYKQYHKDWSMLADRVLTYQRVARLIEKYGLDEEV